MIVFFALLGISCKRKVPEAHTSLEVVRIRYGTLALEVWLDLTDQDISNFYQAGPCLVRNLTSFSFLSRRTWR